jgi:hypothetical protein
LVRIIGLDAAADLGNFGWAACRYEAGVLFLDESGVLGGDAGVAAMARRLADEAARTLIAIDAPLGWPAPMVRVLGQHRAGGPVAVGPNDMFRRETDKWVKRVIGKQALDIGADKIARAAWQALNVLNQLRAQSGQPIPLAWQADFAPRVAAIEVYPAATLLASGLQPTSYKKPEEGRAARRAFCLDLANRAPWLLDLIDAQVDIFDAGLCAIAGADFLDGLACAPEDQALAEREGWIWVRAPLPRPGSTKHATGGGCR